MTAVFYAPVRTIGGKDTFCICVFCRLAGDAICCFAGLLAGFLICAVTFNDKSLSNMREVQIIAELVGSPYFADFNSSMVRWSNLNIIWLLPILKEELDLFKKRGLISFYGKVIVCLPCFDQIMCDLTLG